MTETIEETFVKVGEVKTSLLTLGKLGIGLDGNTTSEKRFLFLIIPGNPGVPHFYKDFMYALYKHSNNQIPVWAVGQAGHVQPPSQALRLSDVCSTKEDIYGLKAQIDHKVAFIRQNIPQDVNIILIGHSIGCYMILNALEYLPANQVLHSFMLFPTIERMAISPNGLTMTPLLRYVRWIVVVMAIFLLVIPETILRRLIAFKFRKSNSPSCFFDGVVRTATPWTANFSTYLAKIEMNQVVDLQSDLIKKHMKKLSLYYGGCDDWAPSQYFYDIKTSFPELDARLCTKNYKHAYVQEESEGRSMAEIVWLWAKSLYQGEFSIKKL